MRGRLDHILALLPFEPAFYRSLNGPDTSYVGHPIIEHLSDLRPSPNEQAERDRIEHPVLLILPGSRKSEVARLLPVFGETLRLATARLGLIEAVLPVVPHVEAEVRAEIATWRVPVEVVTGLDAKWRAFRRARAALAASGTVSLELAVAGVPMVIAYKLEPWVAPIARRLVSAPSVVLANLVLGENVVPERLQEDATAPLLVQSLLPLLSGGRERDRQVEAFGRIDRVMSLGAEAPSECAARIVLEVVETKTGRRAPRVSS